jgi:hypothetical protein
MKKVLLASLVAVAGFSGLLASTTPARADADDTKWINQCIIDNKDEGQTTATVNAYCTCMNDQMSSEETQSISQWEKTHKKEAEACSTRAGWKS